MSKTLPTDMARCHDLRCEVHDYCERFLQRMGDGRHVIHAMTLRPAWQAHSYPCRHAVMNEFYKGENDE